MSAESKKFFDNIRSNMIFKKIFYHLEERLLLKLVVHNKNYQRKLNKNLNDYKYFLATEIELIPEKDDQKMFININIFNANDIIIYLNNNKKDSSLDEIKKCCQIDKVRIKIRKNVDSFRAYFINVTASKD